MEDKVKKIMPKQIASLTFISVVSYLEENYPSIDIEKIINNLNNETPNYIEDLETGEVGLVALSHIKSENY